MCMRVMMLILGDIINYEYSQRPPSIAIWSSARNRVLLVVKALQPWQVRLRAHSWPLGTKQLLPPKPFQMCSIGIIWKRKFQHNLSFLHLKEEKKNNNQKNLMETSRAGWMGPEQLVPDWVVVSWSWSGNWVIFEVPSKPSHPMTLWNTVHQGG